MNKNITNRLSFNIIIFLMTFLVSNSLLAKDTLTERKAELEKSFKKQDSILILSDLILMKDINPYFDENPLKKLLKSYNHKKQYAESTFIKSLLPNFDKNDKTGEIINYYLIGGFENRDNFDKKYIPEEKFNPNEIIEGKNNKELRWKKIENYSSNSYINFKSFLTLEDNTLSYLLTYIDVKSSGKYQIRFSSATKTKLFLDSKEIFYKKNRSFINPDQEILLVYLEKGVHSLLFKVDNDKSSILHLRVLNNFGLKSNNIKNPIDGFKKLKNGLIFKGKNRTKLIEKLDISKFLDNAYNTKCKNYKSYYRQGVYYGSCKVDKRERKKDSDYYFKRAIIEERFLSYNDDIAPYPFEENFKKAIELAKTDKEKGKIYFYWSKFASDKNLKEKYLSKAVKLNYYPAILVKIDNNLNNNYLLEVKKLLKKAEVIDKYNYDYLLLKNRYYNYLNLNGYYLKKVEKEYKKSKRKSKLFSFLLSKMKNIDENKKLKILENAKDEDFFKGYEEQLLDRYYSKSMYREYRNYLNVLLKKDRLKYSYQLRLLKFLRSNKQYKQFLDYYNKNENLLYDDTTTLKLVAEVYLLSGNKEKSREYFEKYMVLKPYDNKMKEYLSHLSNKKSDLWAKKYASQFKNIIHKEIHGGYEILWNNQITKINKDYSYNKYENKAIRLNDEATAKSLKYIPLYYSNNERVTNSSLKVIKKDGTIIDVSNYIYSRSSSSGKVISEYKYIEYKLPELNKGDIVEYEIYINNKDYDYDKPFFSSVSNIENQIYTAKRAFLFITPKNINLRYNISPKIKKEGYYYFDFNNLEIVKEIADSGYSSNYKYLVVSTLKSWSEFISWYKNLIKDTQMVPQKIIKDIKKTTKGLKEIDKIKYVHKYVTDNIHYIAVSLGVNGLKPHSVKYVLESKFGDCKDTANLFVSLLKAIDIESYMLIIRTNNLGEIKTNIPSSKYFNHAIAYIPKYDLYVDLTDNYAGLYGMPSSDQHSSAILIKKDEKLRTTKIVESRQFYTIEGEKLKDNSLKAKFTLKYTNSSASNKRYLFNNKNDKKNIENLLSRILTGNKITDINIQNLKDRNKDFILEFNLKNHSFFSKGKINPTLFLNYLKGFPLSTKRETEMRFVKRFMEEKIILKNIKIENKNIEFDNKFFNFKSKIEYKDNKTTIINSFFWKNILVKAKDYQDFKNEYLKFVKYLKTELKMK